MSTVGSTLSRNLAQNIGVLVVSSNSQLRRELIKKLDFSRWRLMEAESGSDAMEKLASEPSDLMLLDPTLPDLDATEFNSLIQSQFPDLQVVTVNSHTGQPLLRSCSPTALANQVVEVLERSGPLQVRPTATSETEDEVREGSLPGLLGESGPMQRVYSVVKLVAQRDTTVVVTGESGTGKDLVAQAIHQLSSRRQNPFVVINCAAIPEPLLEAELFGYVKGAFTGAVQSRIGRIHAAQGGSLFLDEIGEMPLALQSKLLRFLEQGEVQRLGSTDNFKVDVRVIAATNAELRKLMEAKMFREDLFYRLSIFPIQLPPLRDRGDDVRILATAFAQRFAPGAQLTEEALQVLEQHTWPGNVRELRNVVERASILLNKEREIKPEHVIL